MPKNTDDTKYFADEYFDFLVTDYGFERVPEYYVSYEYHFGYRKNKIEINFACEADGTSLPWVTLRNFNTVNKIGDKEYPEYFYLTEIEMTDSLEKINVRRNNFNLVDLKSDYEQFGRDELKTFLKENANIIKRHPQILHGDLEVFPKKIKRSNPIIKTFISMTQPEDSVKTYSSTSRQNWNLFKWFRSLFN